MKVGLVFPPSCDPTAPYLSLPTLTAWLRKHGVSVMPVDANVEAYDRLLRKDELMRLGQRIEQRIALLEGLRSLSHEEQLVFTSLWDARGDAADVPNVIETAVETLRGNSGDRFFDHAAYQTAVTTVEAALRVVGAAYAPLVLDLVAYRTPFSLLTPEEIARDSAEDRNPFHAYYVELAARLRAEGVGLVGLSVAFPGQIQPAFALARVLREHHPDAHVTVGGPAITQILLRLGDVEAERVLGPFHSAVLFEGETVLLEMVERLSRGEDPASGGRVLRGQQVSDLGVLPPPDFDGLPLDRYLSPKLVLPYDPTRGCYWGSCAFCHYGLSEVGTARYRERPIEVVVDHLEALSKKYGTDVFYLSQDAFSPRMALALARGLKSRGLTIRWGSDMRPERSLSEERCQELREGGALSVALGIESAAPRVLSLIDKGITPCDMRVVVKNLARAGIALEAMCFSDFPTESYREAMDTVRFIRTVENDLSLFIFGRFELTHGSRVAQKPEDYGIREVWHAAGDQLKTALFFEEADSAKRPHQRERIELAVSELSRGFHLNRYPWAGALSTAHSLLYYARMGRDAFRAAREPRPVSLPGARVREASSPFDVVSIMERAAAHEAEIWEELVHQRREVGSQVYRALAQRVPHAQPAPGRFRYASGILPEPVTSKSRRHRGREGLGLRPSHSPNRSKR